MSIGERLLGALSYSPGASPAHILGPEPSVETGLRRLTAAFADLDVQARGRSVLDFGCGAGFQSVAFARAGAARVVGIDSNPRTLKGARKLIARYGVSDRVTVREALTPEDAAAYDIVFSQNGMEHFADPLGALRAMAGAVAPRGRIFVTFGPPWFAPRGSHMHFFTPLPWVNLLFPERTVMSVRARYRDDGARRYEEVESGLNRMSVRRFEATVAQAGLAFATRRYRCVKGLEPLGHVPLLRELFVNEISVELALRAQAGA
jgi:SAM-dependent methyltransferase